jgi:hypothetical protein
LGSGIGTAAPMLKPLKAEHPNMAGTTWVGETAEGWAMTLEFQPDGVMVVSYNGMSFNRASWKQEKDKLYYEMNSKYCEFNGTIAGQVIEGETANKVGKVWTTRLTRKK